MSDDNTAKAGEQPSSEDAKGFAPIESQEDFDRRIQERIARERAKFGDYDELKSKAQKLAEIEDRDKSELDKAIEARDAAERRAAEVEERAAAREREALVQVVAAEKKVPAKWLRGTTREELVAAAEEWLEDAKGITPERPVGHIPTAGTGDGSTASSLDEVRERAKAFAGK